MSEKRTARKRVILGVDKVSYKDVFTLYRGEFIDVNELDEVFDNTDEVLGFFSEETLLGAIIDEQKSTVYFITIAPATWGGDPFTRLAVWIASVEVEKQ
jgi:hypothetical protein